MTINIVPKISHFRYEHLTLLLFVVVVKVDDRDGSVHIFTPPSRASSTLTSPQMMSPGQISNHSRSRHDVTFSSASSPISGSPDAKSKPDLTHTPDQVTIHCCTE